MSRPRDRKRLFATMLVAVVFGMGPTVGDIGSCAQYPDDLDARRFFSAKRALDCRQCRACALQSRACQDACSKPPQDAFPEGCRPLVHDGEVCLDVLRIASCDDYAKWMADTGATAPSECQFCPVP